MSDAKETDEKAPKKKGKLGKIIVMVVGVLVLLGGGVGAGLYAANSGLIGGGGHAKEDNGEAEAEAKHPGPKLVPKSEQKRTGAEGAEGGEGGHGGGEGGGEGGHGEGGGEAHENKGMPTPVGDGGERYASNYYELPKDFTSNMRDSVHIIQVGLAISTPYDDTVINNLKTNDLAVRSAILMTLGDANEEMVFSSEGKRQLQRKLVDSINEEAVRPGFHGDPFINAAAQFSDPADPVRVAVTAHRDWYADRIEELFRAIGHPRPGDAADDLILARDGALAGGYVGDPIAAGAALHRALDRILAES